jgi:hypothetical protein
MRQDVLKVTGAAMVAGAVHFSYGKELYDWKCGPQYRWTTDVDINWKEKWKDCEIRPSQQSSEAAARVNDAELEIIFKGLAKNWQEATGSYSLNMRRYAHPTYQVLMAALGKENVRDIVPLILRELQERPDVWFEALKVLTKANPAQDCKAFDEAVAVWVRWWEQEKNNY